MALEKFAVFILTHGRPQRVKTFQALRRQGYTGAIYLLIDNEDEAARDYQKLYGDRVIVFDKLQVAQTFDEGDNFEGRRGVVYARNVSFEIARNLGLGYFMQLDDDYSAFLYRFSSDLVYWPEKPVGNLDRLFTTMLAYYKKIPALTLAMGQSGDFMGGAVSDAGSRIWLKRKAMNVFLCSVNRPFQFLGRINEDVTTYVTLGNWGHLFLTFFLVAIRQPRTQQSKGGLTELYLDLGTYVKSFYPVMYTPSCVKISELGYTDRRIHHKIYWRDAVPCIIDEAWRKP